MDDCIEYAGKAETPKGYKKVSVNKKLYYAHRLVGMLFLGLKLSDIKTQVCHKCDNPRCINPAHLFLGTGKDNMADCRNKGRNNARERNGQAKLTQEQVDEIRSDDVSLHRELATKYGVARTHISSIKSGVKWK